MADKPRPRTWADGPRELSRRDIPITGLISHKHWRRPNGPPDHDQLCLRVGPDDSLIIDVWAQ